jgi:Flp pilus assembly protein TadB
MKLRDRAIALFLVSTVVLALIDLWRLDGPIWALVIVAAPIALAGLALAPFIRQGYRQERRADRLKSGRCLACGYSLRGNTSGVCPECGTPVRP